jgi:hypothetical protein
MDQTQAVVVSTLMEAWEVMRAGLVADSIVKDVSIQSPGVKIWNNGIHRSCTASLLQSTK